MSGVALTVVRRPAATLQLAIARDAAAHRGIVSH
jgi:hypothetical protein